MSEIPPNVAQLTGPLLLGLVGNWGLFGCSAVQVYLYYLGFPKDNLRLKALVYGLFIWDILQTALYTSTVFASLASGWGNLEALEALGLIWFDIPFMSGVASCVVQCFYAWRIYVLGKSIPLALFIVALALMEGSAAMALGITIKISVQTFADLQSKTFVVTTVWLLGSASCDVIISVFSLQLTRARKFTSYRHTENMLSRLIGLTVGGGLLTTSVAIVDAVMYIVFQHNNYHAAPVAILAKLYTNALMVLFNSRRRHENIHSTVNYTWDGEGPPSNRPGISANSTFNSNFNRAISVDVNVDRTTDAPAESYSMAPFNKQVDEGFGSLEGESKARW
ncbi:hypothetical protein GGU11DRAFT_742567 [Lentinula aff. detonsa]|uniref:DUF6534 domain-containing protein n=1 Tax=Lentinula aff. detonsa TaxID=2804958 RepID=A0AA38L5Z6_9AGAR|nr:hypothetical protein GGU10DRAFT_375052 [Lentinula aff. detonsa]KAJ3800386.1 hypothetical protein GGU11DRAFT_742567 [Lentinula aff. detonsa]